MMLSECNTGPMKPQLCFPNGHVIELSGDRTVFGRGSHACLDDDLGVSTTQFALSVAHGACTGVLLESMGMNPLVVEVRTSDGTSPPTPQLLERGNTMLLNQSTRFLVLASKEPFLFHVVFAGQQPHQQYQQPQQQPLVTQQQSVQPAPVAAVDAAAYVTPSRHKRQHVIDLTLDGVDDDGVKVVPQPAVKASRREVSGSVPTRTTLMMQDTPFKLMKIRPDLIPDDFNFGCLGADLTELLPPHMEYIMVSVFEVDAASLVSTDSLLTAQHMLVCYGKLHGDLQELHAILPGRLQLHQPPLSTSKSMTNGTHHSKFFIVQYERGLRVIILTSNTWETDFTEGIWWQDFPPKDSLSPPTSHFEEGLTDYMRKLQLPHDDEAHLLGLLARYDMSSARAALVPSVPGRHGGADLHKYGHMRVRHLLSKERLPASGDAGGSDWARDSQLVLQCSSLGFLDEKWFTQEMAMSMSGIVLDQATVQPALGPTGGGTSAARHALVKPSHIHLVWPTVQEVRDSLHGWRCGCSLVERNCRPFLHPHFSKYGGQPVGRQHAIPHIKTYCRFLGQQLAWAMLASHNVSKSAWGWLINGGSELMVRSYELGTLFTPSLESSYRQHRHHGFCCTTPLPPCTPSPHTPTTRSGEAGTSSSGTGQQQQQQQQQQVEFWSMQHLLAHAPQPTDAGHACQGNVTPAAQARVGTARVMVPLPYTLPPDRYDAAEDEPWVFDRNDEGVDWMGQTKAQALVVTAAPDEQPDDSVRDS